MNLNDFGNLEPKKKTLCVNSMAVWSLDLFRTVGGLHSAVQVAASEYFVQVF